MIPALCCTQTTPTPTHRLLLHCIHRAIAPAIQSVSSSPVFISKSLQLSGKMGIKQINYRNSPSIEQLESAVRTSNSHCRNQQLHKSDPSRKGLCCAAGVYNLCITNIITSMTLGRSYLFVCKNSSEAFRGVSFALSSTVSIILGP